MTLITTTTDIFSPETTIYGDRETASDGKFQFCFEFLPVSSSPRLRDRATAKLRITQSCEREMAWNYDYEIRRKSSRRHRSSRPDEYEHRHSSYAPSSYRSRYRGKQPYSNNPYDPNNNTDPPYPTHYPDTTYRTNITTLPNDIKLSVFDHLDPVSSACLGLSSRHLYPSHRYLHKNVSLYEQADGNTPLVFQLKDWAPDNLMLDPRSGKYVSRERYERGDGRRSWKKKVHLLHQDVCLSEKNYSPPESHFFSHCVV